jgi:hypothetical protein
MIRCAPIFIGVMLLLALLCARSASAQTLEDHRSRVIQVAGSGVEKSLRPTGVWFSSISNLSASSGNLAGADGSPIFSMPAVVASGYDSSAAYDVSGFYQGLRKTRVNFILNYSTETLGEVISFGFDPGARSEKATVNRALFLGYTRAFMPQRNLALSLSAGAWILGGLSESPCVDSYDRQYDCKSLTAWSDYSQPKYRTPYYLDFRLGFKF